MDDESTGDPTHGRWSYAAFFVVIAAYIVTVVWLSVGVNALSGEWLVGSYWFGALVGLIAVEQALERWLF